MERIFINLIIYLWLNFVKTVEANVINQLYVSVFGEMANCDVTRQDITVGVECECGNGDLKQSST